MKNKNVGFLIIGISIIILILIMLFNTGMKNIIIQTCSHGLTCSMYSTLSIQTWISVTIIFLLFIIGLFLIFTKEHEKIIIKKIKQHLEKKKQINYNKLDKEEKVLMKLLEESEGTIFQSDLVEKSDFNKVKVTRILDRLEGKQLIERKRRGMTNIIILKS